jgi:hypothetical protein
MSPLKETKEDMKIVELRRCLVVRRYGKSGRPSKSSKIIRTCARYETFSLNAGLNAENSWLVFCQLLLGK